MHICYSINKNCWNLYDSYGEICVHCGCCSKDKDMRRKSRLELCERMLKNQLEFNDFSDSSKLREIQENNNKSNIKYYKQRIKYYKNRIEQ